MAVDICPELLRNDLCQYSPRFAPHSIGHEKLERLYSALRDTRYGELARVRLKLDDGQVELFGKVSKYFLKQLAQETIRPLAIGLRIVNHLEVPQT